MAGDSRIATVLASALKGPRNAVRYVFSATGREADLLAALEGRTVAVVGNARSLEGRDTGIAIEAHDIVVRFNRSPVPDPRSHGSRTDWIAAGAPIDAELVAARGARRVVWVTKLRKLPDWMYGSRSVTVLPRARQNALERQLGSRPSSGVLMIELLARSKCRAATIYGFDFFQTLSFSGDRDAAQVPHDFAREREFVLALVALDPRFTLDGTGRE